MANIRLEASNEFGLRSSASFQTIANVCHTSNTAMVQNNTILFVAAYAGSTFTGEFSATQRGVCAELDGQRAARRVAGLPQYYEL